MEYKLIVVTIAISDLIHLQIQYLIIKKIPISERIEYLINILGFSAISKASYNNQNTTTTGFYWFEKIFLVLEGCQDDIVLEGDVQIAEMFLSNCQKKEKQIREKIQRHLAK